MGAGGPDEPRGGVGHADLHALADDERERAVRTVGIPQQVSAAGIVEALPITATWLDSLEDAVAFGRIDQWGASIAEDPAFTALVYRTMLTADMGGQLFVRTIEVPESVTRVAPLAVVREDAFFALPFEEAIASFLARKLITPEEYRRLSADARARAFSVSRMTSDELVKRVRDTLGRTLEDGGTYRDFVASVRSGEIDLGIAPTSSGYLENIFRTNTATSYGAGRLRQLTDPAVVAARPFLEYRTARDSRVRETHAALEGVVFRQDDPGWRAFNPPLGYMCRCNLVARRDADPSRVVLSSSLPRDAITPGFGVVGSAVGPAYEAPPTARPPAPPPPATDAPAIPDPEEWEPAEVDYAPEPSHEPAPPDDDSERPTMTVYRAAEDDYIPPGSASFSPDQDVAEAYRDNPGFGGPTLFRAEVPVPREEEILRLYDHRDPIQAIADEAGLPNPGAITPDVWVGRDPEVQDALRAKGYQWVEVMDTYPEGARTWIWIGDSENEPELEEVE